ncbi:hypothetical protein LSAT2_015269 [Lamellibrachia satsuma]|nr:hypothetical protein LSAT2_015269 [Lamellibrachia satsuma]
MNDDQAVLFSIQTRCALATFARIRDVFVLQVKAGANSYDNYAPTVDQKRVIFVFTKWPAQTASRCEISEGKDEGTGDSTARGKAIETGWWTAGETVGVFGETVEVSEPQALWRLLFLLQLGLWPVLLDLVWMLLQREQRMPSLRMEQWQVALV